MHHKTRRGLAGLGLGLVAALTLGACTSEPVDNGDFDINTASWEQIVEQAKKEGEVTLYLALGNYESRLLEGWNAVYPEIKLTIVREPSGSLITKALAEKDANVSGGDVVFLSDYRFFDDYNDNLAKPLGPSPALYQGVDPNGGDKFFTVLSTPFTLISNPSVLEEIGAKPINDWPDLLQPELKGLIGITRPDITPIEAQLQHQLHLAQGPAFLETLSKMDVRLGDSSATLAQSVAAGDLAVAIGATTVSSVKLKEEGAPIVDPIGKSPEVVIGYAAAALDWSKRPAAAQVLLEWLISEAGQSYQHDWGVTASVLPSVPNPSGVSTEKIFTGLLSAEEQNFLDTTWASLFAK